VASAAFRESGHAALEAQGIRVVDEPLGVIRLELGNGFALRELAEPSRGASLVPMFGLYSQRPGREALIHEMIEASGKSAQDFVDRQIIEPLIRHFHFIYWRIGLIGEPHEQNVLMEVQDLKPTGRFFYRDMAGFHLDLSVRARLGTGLEFLPPGIGMASLKLGRARLTDNAVDYLLRSNFYSLQKSVAARYPEVTQDFVEERFRYHMQRQFYKQGGIKTGLQIPDWVAAMKRTGQQHRFSDMSCADLFRVLMRESL
jgi:hypothetical protein